MTNKRFTIVEDDEEFRMICDNVDGRRYGFNSQLINLLNVMNDTLLEFAERNSRLSDENEYLRNELKEVCNRNCDKCKEEWCDGV